MRSSVCAQVFAEENDSTSKANPPTIIDSGDSNINMETSLRTLNEVVSSVRNPPRNSLHKKYFSNCQQIRTS